LSKELANKGHEVSHTVVGELLQQAGYSLQANRKTREGNQHIDRDAQFLGLTLGSDKVGDERVYRIVSSDAQQLRKTKSPRRGQKDAPRQPSLP
jgi:hypothetical protein